MAIPSKRSRVQATLIPKNKDKNAYYLTLNSDYQQQIAKVFRQYFDSDEQMLNFLV